MSEPVVDLAHSKFKFAESGVFTRTVVEDCMTHRCQMHATGAEKLEACCQYGCDVDLFERASIVAHADDILRVLSPDAPGVWFDDSEPEHDPDTRSGIIVRTAVHRGGCIFLAQDQRGCSIHRAGLESGWNWRDVKPSICQLFPLSYTSDTIVVSDDYVDYSCAYQPGAPTLYRVAREALRHVFGESLVAAMDAAEAELAPARRLPIAK
jgi:Fe-S-cluster containining protein